MNKLKFSIFVGNLLFFSSLCLGQNYLNYVQTKPKYAPMPISKRADLVPRMGFCSTTPPETAADIMLTGNGAIRASIYGDPYAERISYTRQIIGVPIQEPMPPPKIAHILPDVRKMLLEGKFREVNMFVMDEVLKDPLYGPLYTLDENGIPHQPMRFNNGTSIPPFNMTINSAPMDNVTDYLRVSDWTTGETRIHWTDAQGAHVRRSFVSFPAQAACQLLTAPKGSTLSCTISLDQIGGLAGRGGTGSRTLEFVNMDSQIEKNEGFMTVRGQFNKEITESGFTGVVRVVLDGGSIKVEDGSLVISGANKATILAMIEPLPRYSEEGVKAVKSRVAALKADYEALLAENTKVLAPQMESSTVRLCSDYEALKSVEELLVEQISVEGKLSAPLFEKLFHMGRYWRIISVSEESPGVGAQWNINVNLQIHSDNITGLHKQLDVLFRMFESKYDDFRLNAQNIFGCRGIMANIHPNAISGFQNHFSASWPHQYWIPCAGWVFNEYWGYYLTTADEKFLRERVVPGLKEIALFFEDYLTDIGPDGRYLFYPGFSAENLEEWGRPIGINCMQDVMVCREVLTNLLTACATLGISDPKEGKWRDMLSKLPAALLDETTGSLREYAWDAIEEDLDHRHVSQHHDVWPGNAITWEETPELALAVLKSNRERGMENESAHGLMMRLFTAIRLKDEVHACSILKELFEHGFVNRTLLTSHNPNLRSAQSDAQGSLPAVLAEMAVYSKPGLIELLPAMPGMLAKGEFTGLCLFTFAKLERLNWDLNENTMSAHIMPLKDQTITLRIRQGFEELSVDGVSQFSQRNEITLSLKKGVPVDISAKLRPKTNLAFK